MQYRLLVCLISALLKADPRDTKVASGTRFIRLPDGSWQLC